MCYQPRGPESHGFFATSPNGTHASQPLPIQAFENGLKPWNWGSCVVEHMDAIESLGDLQLCTASKSQILS